MDETLISKFSHAIRKFDGDPAHPDLLMVRSGPLSVHYAPFDVVNPQARVVIVGITPGRTQAINALAEARRQLASGASLTLARANAKETGAFSGTMRTNLTAMLDRIGLSSWLGLDSCVDLFERSAHLLQSASVIPFPTFVDGANYNGKPDIVKTPILLEMMKTHFVHMATGAENPVIVPLGPVPDAAIFWLAQQGMLDARRVLRGLPHPSSANAERIQYFLGRKPKQQLSVKTDPARLDAALDRIIRSVNAL